MHSQENGCPTSFEIFATAKAVVAMMHVALEKPDAAKLRIRTGNGLQHASGEFGEFLTSLGMRRGFI